MSEGKLKIKKDKYNELYIRMIGFPGCAYQNLNLKFFLVPDAHYFNYICREYASFTLELKNGQKMKFKFYPKVNLYMTKSKKTIIIPEVVLKHYDDYKFYKDLENYFDKLIEEWAKYNEQNIFNVEGQFI